MGKEFEAEYGRLKVTTTETVIKSFSYDYSYLLSQKENIQAQKDRDNAQRDLELAEIDQLISEAKKASIDQIAAIAPIVEAPIP